MTVPDRRAVERALGHRVADAVWELLGDSGQLESSVGGQEAVEDAAATIRDYEGAFGSRVSAPRAPKVRADVGARLGALGAVYAAQVASDTNVRAIRSRLGEHSDPLHREPMLLQVGAVASWVAVHYMKSLGITSADQATDAVHTRLYRGEKFERLYFPSPRGSGRAVDVPARSLLGELAVCSAKVADTYRWWPVDATRVILTGEARPVVRSSAGLAVRYGRLSATTRITLQVDPEMRPEEVQAAYLAARSLIMPSRRARVRPLTPKAVELARWAATRPPGETWADRMRAWNRTHSQWAHAGPATNFARDARSAYRRLTDRGWVLQAAQQGGTE